MMSAAVAALATLVVGFTMIAPSANRLGTLNAAIQAAGGPPTAEQQAEMARLQARMTLGSRLAAFTLASDGHHDGHLTSRA
ncbi:MAG TPA: hypothetical protein VH436_14210 [Vicinamibacterales bacterium]|jgi:hypothetical protein